MPTNKKYDYQITELNNQWTATVTRKASRKKSVTTKEQSGFSDESAANEWAKKAVSELMALQNNNNKLSAVKRKDNEEIKRQRSARRAEKTEKAKLEAAEKEAASLLPEES